MDVFTTLRLHSQPNDEWRNQQLEEAHPELLRVSFILTSSSNVLSLMHNTNHVVLIAI